MRKLKDEEEKELRRIACTLPPDFYTVTDSVTMLPACCQMNHYRRLKKAFLSSGIEGVTKYVQPYLDKRKLELQNERIKAN